MESNTSELSTAGASTPAHSFSPKSILDAAIKRLVHTDVGLVLLVFFLGFIVRAQLMRYELFFEFDSYWHARMVSYILQGLPAPIVDPLAYYQNVQAAMFGSAPLVFWYISAAFYKIFTLNAPYHFEWWVLAVKILPALFGAFICVAMYFLGKELFRGHAHEREAGLLAGLFAAIVPSFVYRTMGGFFEDDSLGFFWMVVGFIFFVRAARNGDLKKENVVNAVLAGVSFAMMAFTWSAFNMLVPILLGVGVVEFLIWLRNADYSKAKNFGIIWIISFLLLSIGATLQYQFGWLDQFGGILGNLFFGKSGFFLAPQVIGFIIAVGIVLSLVRFWAKRGKISPNLIHHATTVVILLIVIAPLLVFMFDLSLRTGDVLGQTVGEESEGSNYFGNKYSFMVIFAFIGLPACGYLLLKRARQYSFLVLPLVWLVVTFFMAWGKLKFTYYWGLPLALMGAIVCVLALKWMNGKSISMQKYTAIALGFLVICGVAAGTIFVTQNVPNIEISPGWKEALFWANKNLPNETKFFNWWDEGHWISFLSGKGVLIDNRNADTKATADVARFIISEDANEALQIVKKYGSTHLIFGDDLLGKLPNLGFYAYNTSDTTDPRFQGIFGAVMPCSLQIAPLTREQSYGCGSNTFSVSDYESLPTSWSAMPNNNQQGASFHVYRNEEKTKLFAFTPRANNMMLVRLWMNDPRLNSEYMEIYRNTGGVRIYSIEGNEI